MDDKRKQELRLQLAGLVDEPWHYDERTQNIEAVNGRHVVIVANLAQDCDLAADQDDRHGRFITAAPTAIRELLDEVEWLERERDEARRMALCLRDEARVNEMGSKVHWDDAEMPWTWEETLGQWRKELGDES